MIIKLNNPDEILLKLGFKKIVSGWERADDKYYKSIIPRNRYHAITRDGIYYEFHYDLFIDNKTHKTIKSPYKNKIKRLKKEIEILMNNQLEEIFKRQKKFQINFYDPDNLDIEEKITLSKEYILSVHKELSEVLDTFTWKSHVKYDKKGVNKDELLEEVIDSFKFLLNIPIIWGIDSEKFYEMFLKKSEIVEERFKKQLKSK